MRKILLPLTCFFILSFMARSQSADLFDKLLYVSKKDTLPYRLLKPVNPGVKAVYPLFIFLHGAGERGNDNEAQIKHISDLFLDPHYRGKYPCYVLAPQCPKGEVWADYNRDGTLAAEPSDPAKLVIALIAKINNEFPIDKSRIYISGVSMGGFGTWDLMARLPGKFAAAIPVCGGGDVKTAERIKHIPVWAFHGAKDDVVSPKRSRAMVAALRKAGGLPGYTEYPDVAHNSWVYAYQEPHLLPWLFKQKLAASEK